jgi:hypothetical protein
LVVLLLLLLLLSMLISLLLRSCIPISSNNLPIQLGPMCTLIQWIPIAKGSNWNQLVQIPIGFHPLKLDPIGNPINLVSNCLPIGFFFSPVDVHVQSVGLRVPCVHHVQVNVPVRSLFHSESRRTSNLTIYVASDVLKQSIAQGRFHVYLNK